MRRMVWLVVVSTALNVCGSIAVSAAGSPSGGTTFHTMPCPADTFLPGVKVDCGFVRVPENRADPSGRTITVAAAVIRTDSAHPRPDPIVFLDGGPSFGAISPFAPGFYFDDAAYSQDRDVVLVDTRGTGLSTPRLGCPELDRAEVRAFYAGASINSQTLPIYRHALEHCRDRLTARGIDLAAYNSAESAADLEALRQALGIHRWNLMAISADGTLGLTYLRLYPHAIRSAVIDSGETTQVLWGLDYDRGLAQELDSIFAGCAANTACNAKYPGLRHAFFRTVRRLQRHPVTITFPAFQPKPVKLVQDGVGLYFDALNGIFAGDKFSPSAIPDLIDQLWRESHGQVVQVYRELFGTGPVENGHANEAFAQGKSMSYICHDQVNFITKDDLRQAARDLPPLAPRYLARGYDLADGFNNFLSPAGCRIWNVGRAPRVQHDVVSSPIPTLVLAGEYDTGVPPYIVHQATAGLSRSRYFEFPGGAHLQLASYNTDSDCARVIATEFLDKPAVSPDASCIASLPSVDFTPGSVFRTPPISAMPVEYLTPAIEDRALEVQLILAGKGKHRAPSIPDLLIAATAELAGLTALHLDKDFELIADLTGQPVERLRT